MTRPSLLLGCLAGVLIPLVSSPAAPGLAPATSRTDSIRTEKERLESMLARSGEAEALEETLEPFREAVLARVQAHRGHRSEMAVGEMIYNSEICQAAVLPVWDNPHVESGRGTDPLESIVGFDRQLRKIGVDLIVIPVPSKIEAYPEPFGVDLPAGTPVSLGRVRFMLDLLEEGVEVLDLLPGILARKPDAEVPLFETAYHHQSGLGARIAGELVAERLRRYSWIPRSPGRFRDEKRMSHERHHSEVPMWAWPVVDRSGKPYAHVPDSPVVVIGDSNSFAHGTASWSSQIARALGLPITELSRSGGGPTAHVRLAEQGSAAVEARKVVLWIVTSSHIQRHPWRKATMQDGASVTALLEVGKIDDAVARVEQLQKPGAAPIDLDEDRAHDIGKELLAAQDNERAIRVYRVVTLAFPDSAIAFEKLGAAYRQSDDDEQAAACYRRVLDLNPFNRTVTRILKEMGIDYEPPPSPELTERQITAVVGTYGLDAERTVEISEAEGDLFMQFTNNRRMRLVATSPTTFVTRNGFSFRFVAGTGGEKSPAVKIRLGSQSLHAERRTRTED